MATCGGIVDARCDHCHGTDCFTCTVYIGAGSDHAPMAKCIHAGPA